ncbi:MAG: hypothetical protein ABSA83_20490 [Verrucomicrobiota bacterium]|jgi:hypothetical protein
MLAFVYNQKDDDRLVVIDEQNRRRYEAPLKEASCAPFWEGGKVYVLDLSGTVRGFHIASDKLVAEKEETISAPVIFLAEYSRSQSRLFLIQTRWNDQQKVFFHELLAMDFPARKALWKRRIDDPGGLKIRQSYVCVTGLKLVQVFNCATGEKLGGIEAAKAAASADASTHKQARRT